MSNPFAVAEAAAYTASHKKRHYSISTRMAAEAFGTFMLVLGVLGTLTFGALVQGNWMWPALAGGLMLIGAYGAVGSVSGNFNPAVTVGMAVAGRLPWRDVLPYILAQLVGALAAAFVVWAVIPTSFPGIIGMEGRGGLLASTASMYGEFSPMSVLSRGQVEFSMGVAILVEVIFTAVFVGVVLGALRRRRPNAVAIGLTFAAIYLITWHITNGGINPARSFASAVFAGSTDVWRQLWLFFVAPLVGGALAALFYRAFAPVSAYDGLAAYEEVPEFTEVPGYATPEGIEHDIVPVADYGEEPVVEEPVIERVVTSEPLVEAEPVAEHQPVVEMVPVAEDEPTVEPMIENEAVAGEEVVGDKVSQQVIYEDGTSADVSAADFVADCADATVAAGEVKAAKAK